MKESPQSMQVEHILHSVLTILGADGCISPEEMRFFNELCKHLGASNAIRKRIFEHAKQGKGKIYLPEDEADQKRLFYFLIKAAACDGKVVEPELTMLCVIADKMGYSRQMMERFIERQLEEINAPPEPKVKPEEERPTIKCPKCGHEQPVGYRCRRCGIIFEKYKSTSSGEYEIGW